MTMKHLLFSLMVLSSFSVSAVIQMAEDSLNRRLDEVVVRASGIVRRSDKSIFNVSDDVKERSSTALNLIGNMMIPQLSVNEIMEKITSPLGNVQVRINGREADVDKIKSINPENIVKIEWIDNPGLRYGTDVGAVLNIIVVNPTSGYSVMATTTEGLTAFFNNTSASLTVNQGLSQWQAGGWANFRNNLDIFREYNDRYVLPDGTVLQRSQQPLDGNFTQYNVVPYLSYNYYIPDTTNFFVQLMFNDRWKEGMTFKGLIDNTTLQRQSEQLILTETDNNPRNLQPSIYAYYEYKFRGNNTLVLSAAASYNDMLNGHEYAEQDVMTSDYLTHIVNTVRSYSYGYYAEANYIKELGRFGQLTAGVRYTGSDTKSVYLDYDDSVVRQRLDKLYFFGEYMLPVKQFTFIAGLGGTWNKNSLIGAHSSSSLDFTPRFVINWRVSDKSRWSLTYNNKVQSPDISQLSPVTQAIDGVQIQRGNPNLKSSLLHQVYLRYSYSNNKTLNLSGHVFTKHFSNPIFKYYTYEGDKILRSYSNEGCGNLIGIGLACSWQPLPEWISLSADIDYLHYRTRGKGFSHVLDSWEQSFNLEVYHWNCSLELEFRNPASTLWGEDVSRGEFFNIISLQYKWRDWSFGAGMFMPFGKYSQSEKVISELVKQETVLHTNKLRHMPFIRVIFNFNRGHQKNVGNRKLSGGTEENTGARAASR